MSHIKSLVAKVLGLCRKCIYYAPKLPDKDKQLIDQIHQGHLDRPEYGQKRMALHLGINHKRTERVMKLNQIRRPRGRRKPYYCTVSTTNHHYTNLIKDIPQSPIPTPHHIWTCDTSYFKFKGKFWYLVTIMDRTTRQILSSWVGKHHNACLTLHCIKQAIMTAGAIPVYFHTDQGKEFMAQAVTHYLEPDFRELVTTSVFFN